MEATKGIQKTTMKALFSKYDVFIFDCDGVIWTGGKPIPGAFELLQKLHQAGKKVFFQSNSSGRTREGGVAKIRSLGYPEAQEAQFYGSAYVVSQYLKEKHPEVSKVRVLGMDSICHELSQVGISSSGGESTTDLAHFSHLKQHDLMAHLHAYPLDPEVGAVVVGLDQKFNFVNLSVAGLYLQKGAKFVATNDDAYDSLKGRVLPGAGAMVAALEEMMKDMQVENGKAVVVGKPNEYGIELICRQNEIEDKQKIVMIGDRIDTDILSANRAGVTSVLVLTGVTQSPSEVSAFSDPQCTPNFFLDSIGVWE